MHGGATPRIVRKGAEPRASNQVAKPRFGTGYKEWITQRNDSMAAGEVAFGSWMVFVSLRVRSGSCVGHVVDGS
jgi:hypothetical protein